MPFTFMNAKIFLLASCHFIPLLPWPVSTSRMSAAFAKSHKNGMSAGFFLSLPLLMIELRLATRPRTSPRRTFSASSSLRERTRAACLVILRRASQSFPSSTSLSLTLARVIAMSSVCGRYW